MFIKILEKNKKKYAKITVRDQGPLANLTFNGPGMYIYFIGGGGGGGWGRRGALA